MPGQVLFAMAVGGVLVVLSPTLGRHRQGQQGRDPEVSGD